MSKHKQTLEEDLEYLQNALFAQLGGEEWKEISQIQERLEADQYDQHPEAWGDKIRKARDVCQRLLNNATVYKVSYHVFKNHEGFYENGGESYFWTAEKADKFIEDFKKHNDGWTCGIDEPEEVDLADVDLADLED